MMDHLKKGNIASGHICWDCIIGCGFTPQNESDTEENRFCLICDHMSYGAQREYVVGDWLTLSPSRVLKFKAGTMAIIKGDRKRIAGLVVGANPDRPTSIVVTKDNEHKSYHHWQLIPTTRIEVK
jgi:hypothetical protein